MRLARLLIVVTLVLVGAPVAGARASSPPPIGHVFVIVLENKGVKTTFGARSPAPYLARTLRAQGAFLPDYYGIGHHSLDNYIAMISGQAPNLTTQFDCNTFANFVATMTLSNGQVMGHGCVYPSSVKTIANQLTTARRSWKGYMEDMGNDRKREASACGHPPIGAIDNTQGAGAKDQYATRHDPFVYFHSIIDDRRSCRAHVVALPALAHDLGAAKSTPNLSFITPDLCHDGHDATCADGGPGGLSAANTFLRTWVPRIRRAPAFRDGLLIVIFDESDDSSTACCGERPGPNTASPGLPGPGGGRVGAVALSPYIAPGTVSHLPYNHYSLLRSLEALWHLPHLGFAGQPGLRAFGNDVYTRRAGHGG